MKIKEKNNAITLIALVITIIVLLILAGVTISILTGKNGLLSMANKAKNTYTVEESKELLKVKILDIQTKVIQENSRIANLNDVKNYLKDDKDIENFELIQGEIASTNSNIPDIIINENSYAIVKIKGYQFKIDVDLNVELFESDTEIADNNEYLYNMGNVSQKAGGFVGTADYNSEYKINDTNLYTNVTGSNGHNFAYIGTTNKIDLTNYSKIYCLVTTGDNAPVSGNICKLTLNNSQLPTGLDTSYIFKESASVSANQTEYVLEFDIPNECRNADYYIGFEATLKDVYVYKIWIEEAVTKTLYDNGAYSDETGEFVGISDRNSEYAINENNMYSNVTGSGWNATYIGTANKIDLTNYSKIRCLLSTENNASGSGNYFKLALCATQLPSPLDAAGCYKLSDPVGANKTNYVCEFKIPDECKNSNYYVGSIACLQGVYIHKIWLEE